MPGSGRFGFFHGVTALAFLARQRDGRSNPFGDELHQTFDHALVRIDPGAGQNLPAITRPGPTGNLLRAVAIFLVIGNRIVQCCQNDCGKKFTRPLTLLVVECGAIYKIDHGAVLLFLLLHFQAFDVLGYFQCDSVRPRLHITHAADAWLVTVPYCI